MCVSMEHRGKRVHSKCLRKRKIERNIIQREKNQVWDYNEVSNSILKFKFGVSWCCIRIRKLAKKKYLYSFICVMFWWNVWWNTARWRNKMEKYLQPTISPKRQYFDNILIVFWGNKYYIFTAIKSTMCTTYTKYKYIEYFLSPKCFLRHSWYIY